MFYRQQIQGHPKQAPTLARTAQSLLLLVALVMASNTHALEKPEYEVLYKDGKIEYRLYQPIILAETTIAGAETYNDASNEGFKRLFDYITGDNTAQTDIAMTAPVHQSRDFEKIDMTAPVGRSEVPSGVRISFMLPSKYTMDDAPVPTDDRVKLRYVPEKLMAVIRYSGRWTERNINKYETRLKDSVAQAGFSPIGAIESAVYNPPFTPPFMRRNEIMFEVSGYPQSDQDSLAAR